MTSQQKSSNIRTSAAMKNLTKLVFSLMEEGLDENAFSKFKNVWEGNAKAIDKSLPKIRKFKDPKAPKKPRSSYIFFSKERSKAIKEEDNNIPITEISKQVGREWKKMTPQDKKKYEKLAADDKIRYTGEMKDYTPPVVPDVEVKAKPKGPKRPLSAYMLFQKANREKVKAENPEMKVTEMAKVFGRMWKEAKESGDAEPFIEQAKEAREEFNKKHGKSTKKSKKKAAKVEKKAPAKTKKVRATGKKKKTGYMMFCQDTRGIVKESNPDMGPRDIIKELAKQWKDLDEDERAEYNEMADEKNREENREEKEGKEDELSDSE